jgi:hypothetical protein
MYDDNRVVVYSSNLFDLEAVSLSLQNDIVPQKLDLQEIHLCTKDQGHSGRQSFRR